jgi:hypothetical protein
LKGSNVVLKHSILGSVDLTLKAIHFLRRANAP